MICGAACRKSLMRRPLAICARYDLAHIIVALSYIRVDTVPYKYAYIRVEAILNRIFAYGILLLGCRQLSSYV